MALLPIPYSLLVNRTFVAIFTLPNGKRTADLSLVSESSLSGEMQGVGLTQTNQILFRS